MAITPFVRALHPDVVDQRDGAALGDVVDGTPEDVEDGNPMQATSCVMLPPFLKT
jgi:hypothetical protein